MAVFPRLRSKKHFSMFLETPLSLNNHIQVMLYKANKTKRLLCESQNLIPRSALIIIYKSLVRLPIDKCEIAFEKSFIASVHQNLKSVHCACLAGATRRTSKNVLPRYRF